MIRQLLFSSLLLMPCVQSMAQSIKKAENVTVYSVSQNGKYACASNEGVAILWNTENDNNITTFDDQYYYCDCVSNDGVMAGAVGPTGEEKPILFTNDKITYLPMPEDKTWSYGSARGISSDGKMVCGLLSDASIDVMDNATSILPFVWEIDGDNITCTELPFPEKDFTGRCPQGYHPLMVSESKNRILGRQIDYSGMGGALIVWNRTAPGEPWTCTVLGEEIIYKDGPDFPEYPEEPKNVDYKEYMTEEEINAYTDAYNDWWNNGFVGDQPDRKDFITDPTRKAEYTEAMDKYNEAYKEYQAGLAAFNEVYSQRMTDYSLDLYSFSGSFNGRYVGCTLNLLDFSTGFPMSVSYPCYYDLDDDNKFISLEESQYKNTGMGGRITDNGDIVISIPARASMYDARSSYIVPAGGNKAVNVYDFLGEKNDGKVSRQTFVDAGMQFSWEGYDMETYQPVEITDSVLVGTVMLSADGKNAVGFTTNPTTYTFSSWALNSFETTGITTARTDNTEAVLRSNVIENGMIEFVADVEKATLFDLSGATLFSGRPVGNCMTVPAKNGIYVLQSKLKNGAVRTDKIVVR